MATINICTSYLKFAVRTVVVRVEDACVLSMLQSVLARDTSHFDAILFRFMQYCQNICDLQKPAGNPHSDLCAHNAIDAIHA